MNCSLRSKRPAEQKPVTEFFFKYTRAPGAKCILGVFRWVQKGLWRKQRTSFSSSTQRPLVQNESPKRLSLSLSLSLARELAHMLNSLVSVPRRVEGNHLVIVFASARRVDCPAKYQKASGANAKKAPSLALSRPWTRTYVRFLGQCSKTGRREPFSHCLCVSETRWLPS